MKLGQDFTRHLSVTPSLVETFSVLSGDTNPVHCKDDFARQHGFNGRISHGNILGLMVSALVGMELGNPNVLLVSQELFYQKPVYIGDALTLRARVSEYSEAVLLAELELGFFNQDEVEVARGKCRVRFFQ